MAEDEINGFLFDSARRTKCNDILSHIQQIDIVNIMQYYLNT